MKALESLGLDIRGENLKGKLLLKGGFTFNLVSHLALSGKQ